MSATFDSRFEKGVTSTSPMSFVSNAGDVTGTVGSNSDRVLVGYVAFKNSGVDPGTVAMTWNGVSMTAINNVSTPGGDHRIYQFGLIAPATGNQTLLASWSGALGTVAVVLGAISIYSADQSTGWSNAATGTGTSTAMTLALTTASGDMAVAGTADHDATSATITAGTSDWDERDLAGNYEGGHNAAAGASTSLSWTLGSSVAWAVAGVRVLQLSGGGSSKLFRVPSLSGLGSGGPFFHDPLQCRAVKALQNRERYIRQAAASCYRMAAA